MNYKRISYFQYNPYSARIIFIIDCLLKTEEIQEEKRKKKRGKRKRRREKGREDAQRLNRRI